jgi:Fe-Mn family superoxide dismutase
MKKREMSGAMASGVHKAKAFDLKKELKGISVKTNEAHYKLYQGYVNKRNEIEEKVKSFDKSKGNATYSEIGEAKRQETFAANGMVLHDMWFNSLWGDGNPKGEILRAIEKDFGSMETWQQDFKATAMSARGWAILALDPSDGRLHNFLIDLQNQGHVAGTIPILGLDVFEHAYFIDYATDRKTYVDNFFQNINWNYVNKRYNYATKVAKLYEETGLR